MAVINTGLLTKGLKSEFFNRFDGTQTHFKDLATRIPSTSDSETYRWLGTVPQIREWGTGRVTQGLQSTTAKTKMPLYHCNSFPVSTEGSINMADHEVEVIRAALVPLLQEQPLRRWTAYSLWHRIEATNPDLAQRIIERYGPAVGHRGGAHRGPVHTISHILGHGYTPGVIDEKLECDGMVIHSVPVSPNPDGTAIFHWQE